MKTRTASSDLQGSYYDLPVIKAPHWRWYVINYFFLGGLAGSASLIAALNNLLGRHRSITRAARYVSFAALLPSPVLLIFDLGRPERFLNMFRILKLKSPMSLGSWALLNLGFGATIAAVFQMFEDFFDSEAPRTASRALSVLTLPFALFISGYTGVLLAATNVPLWARNYLLLGPTFVASSFSAGLSTISLFLHLERGAPDDQGEEVFVVLRSAERVALLTELALIIAGIRRLGRLGDPLTKGSWGRIFWPVTVLGGIVAPLVLLTGSPRASRRTLASILAIAGGYSLRVLMIFAGRESARRPQDYFEYTRRDTR